MNALAVEWPRSSAMLVTGIPAASIIGPAFQIALVRQWCEDTLKPTLVG